MTGRDQKIIQIVCDQLCKVEKCEECPLESFFEEENKRTEEKRKEVAERSPSKDCMRRGKQIREWIFQGMKEGEAIIEAVKAKPKKCPICGSDLYEYCFMCCYEGEKVMRNEQTTD